MKRQDELKEYGIDERTYNANIGNQTRNGAFASSLGFISQEQKERLDDYLQDRTEENKLQFKQQQRANLDILQTATANLGTAVTRGGGLAGSNGYIGVQRPYLVMQIPNLSIPENYGKYYGFPCNMTLKLGDLSGFTKLKDIHLEGFTCTKTELDEIEALLKQGIII